MYRKKSRGWYKHKDFILIDLACLFMALILAYLIRNGSVRNLFTLGIYRNVMIFVILVDLFLIILFESYKGVLRRGRYQELRSVIRQMILIELASADSNVPQALRGHFAFVEDRLNAHRDHSQAHWFERFVAGELVGNAWTEVGDVKIGEVITRLYQD